MHISKRSNGIYCVWYTDQRGRKKKVSTGKSRKSEALNVFRSFVPPQADLPNHSLSLADLSSFSRHSRKYTDSQYSRSYRENYRASFIALEKGDGNPPLHGIGPGAVEAFAAAQDLASRVSA